MSDVLKSLTEDVEEHPELISATIRGEIPKWLNGTMIRNGPGKFSFGKTSFAHLFDGSAILHSFQIDDGKVSYHSKYIQSQSYKENIANDRIVFPGFGPVIDPCQSIFSKFFSIFVADKKTDNCGVNVAKIKEKTYALTEGPCMVEVNPESLDYIKTVDLDKEFEGPIHLSIGNAHPHFDSDGTVYSLAMTYGKNTTYNIISIPPSSGNDDEKPMGGSKLEASVPPTNKIAYFHSFAMTPNYFILAENPFLMNLWYILLRKPMGWSFVDCLQWDPETKSRFHIIARDSGRIVTTCEADPMFIFHHINAYEENDEIVLDACCYNDASIVNYAFLEVVRGESSESEDKKPVFARRYRLPIQISDESTPVTILEKNCDGVDFELLYEGLELPQINYTQNNGRDYQFLYGISVSEGERLGIFATSLVKVNVKSKEVKVWREKDLSCIPSEPLFIPSPDCQTEDEGIVLSIVLNPYTRTSFLLVLDAQTFEEMGRAEVPVHITPGIHGTFQFKV